MTRLLRVAFYVCAAALLLGACRDSFQGRCVSVSDGDTIGVLCSGKEIRVRLYGVDCPERGQDFARKARQFTSDMVMRKGVQVSVVDKDNYGRSVAWVSVDGKSLNRELLVAGLAWWYKWYAQSETELGNLEQNARQNGIGIWSKPNPIPPWEFRRSKH